jgi:hypothetical protein
VEPVLQLIGLAERQTPEGRVRTAMLATDASELIFAVEGDRVLGRYEVRRIGSEAVELAESDTGRVRRLILQD